MSGKDSAPEARPIVTPNQSYLVKQLQWRLAAAFTAVMRDIDGNVPKVDRAWDAPEKVLWWPTRWRQTYQLFKARLGIIARRDSTPPRSGSRMPGGTRRQASCGTAPSRSTRR